MALNETFLRELNDRATAEQIVSPYVSLKRRGKILTGLCPFHNEKSPSFTVYPDTNSFYCFGCGAGGDMITFIRRIENLDYIEAVKFVAQAVGMQMPEDGFDDTISKKRARILSANREAARFFNKCLYTEEGRQAREYLENRMLSGSTITHFGLGYAPDSWDSLLNHLKKLGYSETELYEANLVHRSEKNGRVHFFDNFRNKVMFPIIDLRGNVIAFGGRVLDNSKPKYINTSDTLVYKKSNAVYALNFAKNSNTGKLILVEGYMDVIALHQAGFTNAIACLGTAFTTEMANLLSRYANDIYICYDSDGPGTAATQRALNVLSQTGLNLKVVKLTGGKDPDEIIKIYGPERFRSLLEGAANKTEYDILHEREKFDISTDDGKMKFLNAAADILASRDSIERDIYSSRLSAETGVSKDAIAAKIERSAKTLRRREIQARQNEEMKLLTNSKDKNNPERETKIRAARAEEIIIASLARNPDFYRKLKDKLNEELFVTAFNRRIFSSLLKKLENGGEIELSFFAGEFSPDEMDSVSRIFRLGGEIANTPEECEDCIKVLVQEGSSKQIKASELSDDEFRKLFLKK